MKREVFCVVHEIATTQLLIDRDYCHEKDEYSIKVKFWCGFINGYVSVSIPWESKHEKSFKSTFKKLLNIDNAVEFANGLLRKVGVEQELKK